MTRELSRTYNVGPEEIGLTLAAALRRWLAGESWGRVRRMISSRRVLVSRNLCLDDQRRLTEGEVVEVREHPLAEPPNDASVVIRQYDKHLVVVEKPAGMITVRHKRERAISIRRKQRQPTLDEAVQRLLRPPPSPKYPLGNQSVPAVRVVHRLDRDTSGLMLFARGDLAERNLVEQFAGHSIQRTYLAVVWGHLTAQTITSNLIRDRGDGLRGSTPASLTGSATGKIAVTHVKPIERLGDYSLIQCELETGRTHQIRIHLSELGHPVCGDKTYRGPLGQPPCEDASRAPRQALHAAELGFLHPATGEPMHFTAPLPGDMQRLLERLRRMADPLSAQR
jgi:23S rRNA pseudouridine1911/1915/1917 synthase